MIIKPDQIRQFQVPFLIILEILALIFIDEGYGIFILTFILLNIYMLLDSIVTWKTIIMDEYGCTLKLFSYERKYSWDEVIIKRKEYNYSNCYKHKDGVFFSTIPVNKPKRMDPMFYCIFKHPMRCFFIYLVDKKTVEEIQKGAWSHCTTYRVYAVDKKEFFSKMEEWNVDLTE